MTPLVIGIDPGTTQSAYVAWDGHFIQELGTAPNPTVAKYLRNIDRRACVVFESVQSYGKVIGFDVLQTVFWTGRLFQVARDTVGPQQVSRLPRRAVKKHLRLPSSARDKDVRAALIRQFDPELWHNLATHQWSAFALAVTWWNTERARQPLKGQEIPHASASVLGQ